VGPLYGPHCLFSSGEEAVLCGLLAGPSINYIDNANFVAVELQSHYHFEKRPAKAYL